MDAPPQVVGMVGESTAPDALDEEVVFVPYEKSEPRAPLQQPLLAPSHPETDEVRAWPRLNDPGLLLEPKLVGDDSGPYTDSAKKDEWDVTPTSNPGRKARSCCTGSALKRCGWRHCCCIASAVLLALVTVLLALYLRLTGEPQFALPPPPPGLIRAPGIPTAPSLEVQQIEYLGVGWTAPESTGGAAVLNYVVETAPTAGGPFSVASTLVSSARYFGLGPLPGANTVCFRVSAANNAGLGNASMPSCFDTLPAAVPMPPVELFPVGAGTGVNSIGVGWSAGNGSGLPIVSYTLESCDESVSGADDCAAGTAGAYSAQYSGPALTFTAEGLPEDARIWWRVATETLLGASAWAPEPPLRLRTDAADATAPDEPAAPSASAVGSDTAEIEWPAVPEAADGGAQLLEYVLTVVDNAAAARSGAAGALSTGHRMPPQPVTAGAAVDGFRGFATSYEAMGLAADTDFCLELEVFNNLGGSDVSQRICDRTDVAAPPTAPQNLWVVNTSSVGVLVEWSAASGNGEQVSSYQLQMDDWWTEEAGGGEGGFYTVATTPGTVQQALVTSHPALRPGMHYACSEQHSSSEQTSSCSSQPACLLFVQSVETHAESVAFINTTTSSSPTRHATDCFRAALGT